MVTICTTSLTFNNSTFCPHNVFMCFVWISEQTAIISLYNINWLVFITETLCVYCAVRTLIFTYNWGQFTFLHSVDTTTNNFKYELWNFDTAVNCTVWYSSQQFCYSIVIALRPAAIINFVSWHKKPIKTKQTRSLCPDGWSQHLLDAFWFQSSSSMNVWHF